MSTWINCFAMDVTRMTRLAHWKFYTMAEKYPEYMDRYSITMERLTMAIPWNESSIWNEDSIWRDRSELLCHQVLLKYKRDRESCWHRLAVGWGGVGSKSTPCWSLARCYTATSSQLRKERQCLREWHQAPPPSICKSHVPSSCFFQNCCCISPMNALQIFPITKGIIFLKALAHCIHTW